MARRTAGRPTPTVDPAMPTDVEALQAQLRLARAQNAYLHRELATAKKNAPVASGPASGSAEEQTRVIADLRERLALLELHYDDLRHQYEAAQVRVEYFRDMAWAVQGIPDTARDQMPMEDNPALWALCTKLLSLAHPDKWSQGQLATELAHELTLVLTEVRAHRAAQ
jgi:hypothetical protein